jgi:serine/threonine-protein kinase RsbW
MTKISVVRPGAKERVVISAVFCYTLGGGIEMENTISMSFKSSLKFTELSIMVLTFLRNILSINDDDYFKIEISLREAVNNAIVHGNHMDLNRLVFITFHWGDALLTIRVKDQSDQIIDYKEIEKKIGSCSLLSYSGRGITIMKNYMDKFEFHCSGTGNEVLLEKKLQ